jgi:class 3 adenylate cyclase
MKRISGFRLFEAEEASMPEESPKRSDRLLTDAQRHYEESKDEEQVGPSPAMVFTDVVGSSKMWSEDAKTMDIQITKHFDLMDGLARKRGGFVVKTIGDAFMIYFPKSDKSLIKAVEFAVEVHNAEQLPLRIGICTGKMRAKKCRVQNVELLDFFGDVVNTASRMESKVSEPGGIAFTSVDDIEGQVEEISKKYGDSLVRIEKEGLPNLKGVDVPFAYRLKIK